MECCAALEMESISYNIPRYMAISLSMEEGAALTDALLRCHSMLDREIRQRVVRQLPAPGEIVAGSVPESHILHIVSHCCRQPHGFESLVDALLNDPEVQGFCDLLSKYLPQPVSWTDVLALKRALIPAMTLEASRVAPLYRRVLAGRPAAPLPEDNGLFRAIDELAKSQARGDRQPLLDFILALRPDMSAATQPAVDTWLQSIMLREKITAVALRPAEEEDYGDPCLMIIVKLGPGEASYEITAELLRQSSKQLGHWHVEEFSENNHCLDEICRAAIWELEGEPAKILNMIVEFFLPDTLLTCDVERWMTALSGPGRTMPLGVEFPVIVRPGSRVYDPPQFLLPRGRWVTKWKRRPKPPGHLPQEELHVARTPADLEGLFNRIKDKYFAFGSVVDLSYSNARQTIADIVDSGVPVAVWPRGRRIGDRNDEAEMRTALCDGDFHSVPQQVFERRKEAFDMGQHQSFFSDLVLFWDDPARIPADSPLMAWRAS